MHLGLPTESLPRERDSWQPGLIPASTVYVPILIFARHGLAAMGRLFLPWPKCLVNNCPIALRLVNGRFSITLRVECYSVLIA